ncbi:NADH-quinone oxidoreductase subunit N [Betaproteobacteria bacterium]|nr:NADH-quinone oxidoreductase subunit N [Betaproteobacteria bacterium]GHU45282.1 NADH-quinone oxidoreductase subunit N [Betaproteobacteria bacterium]
MLSPSIDFPVADMFANFAVPDFFPAAPEIFLLAMTCVILLLDLTVKSPRRTLTFALTQATLLGCALLTLFLFILRGIASQEFVANYTFSNMFVDDGLADFLKLLTYFTVMATLFYSRRYIEDRQAIPKGEYYVLALFATLGMMVMISANHFLTIYLGLELLSLALYATVALNRTSATATEAAMKYFVLGALASGMLLYGMSMLYGATHGALEIGAVAEQLRSAHEMGSVDKTALVFGLVFIVAGLAFKLGVVPFHMWLPDVYHGAPTSVTLLIAAAPKLAAFAMTVRLLVGGLLDLSADWCAMLMLLAVLSMAVGNMVAIMQTNIKRMLAYSAISHMGFMLLGLAAGVSVADKPLGLMAAYSASMFYVVTYVLTTLAAFGLVMLLAREGFESDRLDDFKGLNKRSPWFAAMMMILMLSMAGIPFFVGFFAKFAVLRAVVDSGHYWLAIAAVLFSLIGAFYYLRVIKIMYFDEPEADNAQPITACFFTKALVSANSLAVAAIGLFPNLLLGICNASLLDVLPRI